MFQHWFGYLLFGIGSNLQNNHSNQIFSYVCAFFSWLIQNMKHSFTAFPVQLSLYSEYTVRKDFLFQISFIELNFLHKLKLKVGRQSFFNKKTKHLYLWSSTIQLAICNFFRIQILNSSTGKKTICLSRRLRFFSYTKNLKV